MANGHVEIYDPFGQQNGDATKSCSDTDGTQEESQEYKLLRAYVSRRRPAKKEEVTDAPESDAETPPPSQTSTPIKKEETLEKHPKRKKKKKKGWKRLSSLFSCARPQTEDDKPPETIPFRTNQPDVDDRCFKRQQIPEDKFDKIANRLIGITDEINLSPPELDTDAPDDVEVIIGLLLREQGDQINQRLIEAKIGPELFLNYSFFRKLMNAFFTSTGYRSADPNSLEPQASQKTQIAMLCEMTSRLSAVRALPMNRLLHHGEKYLKDYYSSWAQQEGGYAVALNADEEEVE